MVLTQRAAERLFGTVDAAGRTVTFVSEQPVDVTVRAVVTDPPDQSQFDMRSLFSNGFEAFVSWDVQEIVEPPMGWGGNVVKTYALLPEDDSRTVGELDRRLAGLAKQHIPAEWDFLHIELEARPASLIGAMNLQRAFEGWWGGSWIDILAALRAAATAMLGLACLNFVNLAIAQATGRTVDVGTRKVLGATTLHRPA
jgi:putative ABC transport system permease protein